MPEKRRPARLKYIMAAAMRRSTLLLLALAAGCRTTPAESGDTSIAHAAGPKSTEMVKMLEEKKLAAKTSGPADNVAPGSVDNVGGVIAPVAVDVNQRREFAEVVVNLKDPNGQKPLVYYLMKPEEWHIDKVVQMDAYTKRWRFWRVARTDGKSMPEIDPLRPRQAPPSSTPPGKN